MRTAPLVGQATLVEFLERVPSRIGKSEERSEVGSLGERWSPGL